MSDVVLTVREVLDQKFAQVTHTFPASPTTVIGPINLAKYNIKTFCLKNAGPNIVTIAVIESTYIETQGQDPKELTKWAPSNVDADWEVVDAASAFVNLAVGAFKTVTIKEDARKWWRVRVQTSAGSAVLSPSVMAG